MTSQSFRNLIAWQKAHAFVLDIYRLTESFPNREMYSLTKQIRRSAVSIPANIAEGYRKRTNAEKSRLFDIALGSLEETRYYLILADDLKYSPTLKVQESVDEVGKILYSYNRAVRKNIGKENIN
ncbi:MAG: four helix bundle protein [Acidobacteriota bacterium]|nr:four helix bundle protein [Acidobacteriota bacterium]